MGCVLDVVRVLYSVKRGHPKRDRGYSEDRAISRIHMISKGKGGRGEGGKGKIDSVIAICGQRLKVEKLFATTNKIQPLPIFKTH